MGLWRKPASKSNHAQQQVDVKQLILRLKSIAGQNNLEITQLAIQSIIDELEDRQGVI